MKWPSWLNFGYRYVDAADQPITRMTATGRIEAVKPNLSHGASLPREIFDGPSRATDPAWLMDEITKLDAYTTAWTTGATDRTVLGKVHLEVTYPTANGTLGKGIV